MEGCEAVLVGLETLVARCAQQGVRRIELGMPHRGRLNVLCNILKKPPGALYGEMEGGQSEFHVGDVKYHLGQSASLEYANEVAVCACWLTLRQCLAAVLIATGCMYSNTTICSSTLQRVCMPCIWAPVPATATCCVHLTEPSQALLMKVKMHTKQNERTSLSHASKQLVYQGLALEVNFPPPTGCSTTA